MNQPTAFVIQSYGQLSDAVYEIIASSAVDAGVTLWRADHVQPGTHITEAILNAIKQATFLIADISDANPNVMYEVGVAQASGRPIILLARSSRAIPFDLAGVRVIIYDLGNPEGAIAHLTLAMRDALKAPEKYSLETALAARASRESVFISYSHFDGAYLDRLLVHLKPLEREGLIDLWVDTRINPGDRWKAEIKKALSRATVAVLLVSADFLASDFIVNNELPPLLRDAEQRGTRIIPVILKPCRFTRDKNLKHFQAINNPANPLIQLSEGGQEAVYDLVAQEVERLAPSP